MECDSFFGELWKAADSPTERAVPARLIKAGAWVLLTGLIDEAGGKLPKKVLDRLAILVLVHRTIVDGAAAAKVVSPLLADWAGRTKRADFGIPGSRA